MEKSEVIWIQAKQVKDRGMKPPDVKTVDDRHTSEFVGFPNAYATLVKP